MALGCLVQVMQCQQLIAVCMGLAAQIVVAGRMEQRQVWEVFFTFTCENLRWQEQQLRDRLPQADHSLLRLVRLQTMASKTQSFQPGEWLTTLPKNSQFAWELFPALVAWVNRLPPTTTIALLGWRRCFSAWRQPAVNLKPLQLSLTPADLWSLPYSLPGGCVLQQQLPTQRKKPDQQLPETHLAEALNTAQPLRIFAEPILEYTPLKIDPEPWLQHRDHQLAAQCQNWAWPWRQELERRRHSRWLAAWQAFEQGDAELALKLWRRGCCHSQAPLAKQFMDALRLFSYCQELQPAPVSVADLLKQASWKSLGCTLLGLKNPHE